MGWGGESGRWGEKDGLPKRQEEELVKKKMSGTLCMCDDGFMSVLKCHNI